MAPVSLTPSPFSTSMFSAFFRWMETSTHKRHSPNGEHSSKSITPVFEKYFGAYRYPKSFALRVEYPTVGHRPTERIHTYAKIFGQAAKYFSNAGVLGSDVFYIRRMSLRRFG